jgi:hypothetical protein
MVRIAPRLSNTGVGYKQLKDIEYEVLIPELYNIVIDYTVEVPEYESLKSAFINRLPSEGIRIYNGSNIELRRSAILSWNRRFWKEAELQTCDQCSTKFYATLGHFYCNGEEGHPYHICLICRVKINPEEDIDLYDRRCQLHPILPLERFMEPTAKFFQTMNEQLVEDVVDPSAKFIETIGEFYRDAFQDVNEWIMEEIYDPIVENVVRRSIQQWITNLIIWWYR